MVPSKTGREDVIRCMSASSDMSASSERATTAWIIPTIVIGTITVTLAAVSLFIYRTRSRVHNRAHHKDPWIWRTEFWRRCRITPIQRIESDELQRQMLIQKALASQKDIHSVDTQGTQMELEEVL